MQNKIQTGQQTHSLTGQEISHSRFSFIVLLSTVRFSLSSDHIIDWTVWHILKQVMHFLEEGFLDFLQHWREFDALGSGSEIL